MYSELLGVHIFGILETVYGALKLFFRKLKMTEAHGAIKNCYNIFGFDPSPNSKLSYESVYNVYKQEKQKAEYEKNKKIVAVIETSTIFYKLNSKEISTNKSYILKKNKNFIR